MGYVKYVFVYLHIIYIYTHKYIYNSEHVQKTTENTVKMMLSQRDALQNNANLCNIIQYNII